jgi:hypothetical protein
MGAKVKPPESRANDIKPPARVDHSQAPRVIVFDVRSHPERRAK